MTSPNNRPEMPVGGAETPSAPVGAVLPVPVASGSEHASQGAVGAPAGPPPGLVPGEGSPLKSHKKHIITIDIVTPPRARWFDRTLATLIDLALLFTPVVVGVLLAASASPDATRSTLWTTIAASVLGSVGVFIGQTFLEGMMGQTIGKMILGIVVVDDKNAELIGFNRAMVRNFVKLVLDIAPGGTGILAMARDTETVASRGDGAAGTAVLYAIRRAPVTRPDQKEAF